MPVKKGRPMSNIPIPQPDEDSPSPEDRTTDHDAIVVDEDGNASLDPLPVSPDEVMGGDESE